MGSEEFLNRMVEALGIIIDRHSKGGPDINFKKAIELIHQGDSLKF